MKKKKHEIGDVWKDEFNSNPKWGGKWSVQFPKGILPFRTKKIANEAVRVFNLKDK